TSAAQSDYISAVALVTTTSTATISFTLTNLSVTGDIAMVGTANSNGINWVCGTGATTVGNKYLPINCRS
ncbi:MAG: pilin, partial [Gammaproteobacteria bacterium]